MIHKPVSSRQHPVSADHIEVTFRDGIDVVTAADARILIEKAGLLPPVIIAIRIDLKVLDRKDGKLRILALGFGGVEHFLPRNNRMIPLLLTFWPLICWFGYHVLERGSLSLGRLTSCYVQLKVALPCAFIDCVLGRAGKNTVVVNFFIHISL